MRRREFITAVGGAAAWPFVVRAQQSAMSVTGFPHGASAWEYADVLAGFREGLRSNGHVDGKNLLIEYRWATDITNDCPRQLMWSPRCAATAAGALAAITRTGRR